MLKVLFKSNIDAREISYSNPVWWILWKNQEGWPQGPHLTGPYRWEFVRPD